MNNNSDRHLDEILIVDDKSENLRLLTQLLADAGYKVRAVTSGERALTAVRTMPPDLILLDIRMPVMDGFLLASRLKSDPHSSSIPIIFISALDDIEDKMKAFSVGGVDYITKPFQHQEILARVNTHISLIKLQRTLMSVNSRLQKELTLAGKIQSGILPQRMPEIPGWTVDARLIPAREMSGDFYDLAQLAKGKYALVVADVSDKGAGAGLYMALCCTLIRTYAAEFPQQPELVLQAVNHRLLTEIACEEFVTVFYGVLDPKNGQLIYANAGHNPPLLVRGGNSGQLEMLTRTGIAMGVLEDAIWERQTTQLEPGDWLLLYTDGITDAENSQGEFYEQSRLLQFAKQCDARVAASINDSLLGSVRKFTKNMPQIDDITLLVALRQAMEKVGS